MNRTFAFAALALSLSLVACSKQRKADTPNTTRAPLSQAQTTDARPTPTCDMLAARMNRSPEQLEAMKFGQGAVLATYKGSRLESMASIRSHRFDVVRDLGGLDPAPPEQLVMLGQGAIAHPEAKTSSSVMSARPDAAAELPYLVYLTAGERGYVVDHAIPMLEGDDPESFHALITSGACAPVRSE